MPCFPVRSSSVARAASWPGPSPAGPRSGSATPIAPRPVCVARVLHHQPSVCLSSLKTLRLSECPLGLGKRTRGVFLGIRGSGDSNGVLRLIDRQNRLIPVHRNLTTVRWFRSRGFGHLPGVVAARQQLILRLNRFDLAYRVRPDSILQGHDIAWLLDGRIGLRGDNHPERRQFRGDAHLGAIG